MPSIHYKDNPFENKYTIFNGKAEQVIALCDSALDFPTADLVKLKRHPAFKQRRSY